MNDLSFYSNTIDNTLIEKIFETFYINYAVQFIGVVTINFFERSILGMSICYFILFIP